VAVRLQDPFLPALRPPRARHVVRPMPVLQNFDVTASIVVAVLERTDEVHPIDDLRAGRARAAAKNCSV